MMDRQPPMFGDGVLRGRHEHRLRLNAVPTIVYGALIGFGFAAGASLAGLVLYVGWRLAAIGATGAP